MLQARRFEGEGRGCMTSEIIQALVYELEYLALYNFLLYDDDDDDDDDGGGGGGDKSH